MLLAQTSKTARNGLQLFLGGFEPHQCKVWFGYPTEVWSTISFENQFISLQNIDCHVVHIKTSFKFGHVIGHDTVFVVVPVM